MRADNVRHALKAGVARGHAPRVLALLLLPIALLTSCTLSPRLETSADALHGDTYQAKSITLRNAGGGVLHWEFHSDNPHVKLTSQLAQEVSRGSLAAGRSATLFIQVAGHVLDPAVGFHATLTFRSNGGSKDVNFSLGGVSTCQPMTAGQRATDPATDSAPGPSAPVPVGSELLVSYRTPAGPVNDLTPMALEAAAASARLRLSAAHGLLTLEAGNGTGPDLLKAPPGVDVDALVQALAADPAVAAVQRNYYLELQWNGGAVPDPHYEAQWGLSQFGVPAAWAALTSQPERQVVVAVLDTGVDGNHPDLASKLLPGYDFYRNSSVTNPYVQPGTLPTSDQAHGTHVAGIAAALSNDIGIVGVAFHDSVRLLPVKLFDDCGKTGSLDALVKAIRWAAGLPVAGAPVNENPAHIINMSLGISASGTHPVLDQVTRQVSDSGVLLVAAAGNKGVEAVLSPASAPWVLAVGSVDYDRKRSAFSNYGPQLNLVAPGGFAKSGSAVERYCTGPKATVLSTVPQAAGGPAEGSYACMAGTSMATPFVTGVAAMLMAQDATLSAQDVWLRLEQTALTVGPSSEYGSGLVYADAAVGAPTTCGAP